MSATKKTEILPVDTAIDATVGYELIMQANWQPDIDWKQDRKGLAEFNSDNKQFEKGKKGRELKGREKLNEGDFIVEMTEWNEEKREEFCSHDPFQGAI